MATHAYFTNDPTLSTGHQLHPPGFTGTNAQRVAYPTATLLSSEQWYETDTEDTYQWTGTVWQLLGGDGSTSNTPSSSFTMTNQSLVIGGTYTLGSGVTLTLSTNSRLTVI